MSKKRLPLCRLPYGMRCLLAIVLLVTCLSTAGAQSRKPRYSVDKKGIGPAFSLLEFFSSENCLNCRELPNLVREIESDALMNAKRVFPLVYHIDYLSYPEWKDIYEKAIFSERQTNYNRAVGSTRVLPGQVFINGNWHMDSRKVKAVKTYTTLSMASPAKVVIQLKPKMSKGGDSIRIPFVVKGLQKRRREYMLFSAALAESGVVRSINAGPNADRVFRHYGLVRAFESARFGDDGKGEVEFIFPSGLEKDRASITVFVQDPKTMKIMGAERIFLADLQAQNRKPRSSVPGYGKQY